MLPLDLQVLFYPMSFFLNEFQLDMLILFQQVTELQDTVDGLRTVNFPSFPLFPSLLPSNNRLIIGLDRRRWLTAMQK